MSLEMVLLVLRSQTTNNRKPSLSSAACCATKFPGKLKIRLGPDSRVIQPELRQGAIQTHTQLQSEVQELFATNRWIRNRRVLNYHNMLQ